MDPTIPSNASRRTVSYDDVINASDITAAVFLIIICIVAIVGNLFVIIAVQLTRRLQTSTNVFVVALSITDLLTALTLPFQAISILGIANAHLAYSIVCEVIGAISFIFSGFSIITLIAISFNRYILITQSSQVYQKVFRKRNIILMLTFSTSYPTFFVVLFGANGWAIFGALEKTCVVAEGRAFKILAGTSMVVLMAAILFFYLKIYLHVRRHVRRIQSRLEQQKSSSSKQSSVACTREEEQDTKTDTIKQNNRKDTEAKITKNMLFVVMCFFICMLPITVYLFLTDVDSTFNVFSFIVLSLNCCLNPLIYAWKHPVFRQVFRCMVARRLFDIEEPSRLLRGHFSK